MKSYTNLEQSKKLAEILPLESADMVLPFTYKENNEYIPGYAISRNYIEAYNEMLLLPAMDKDTIYKLMQPCWSLAALLDVLPTKLKLVLAINDYQGERKERYAIESVEHNKYDCYADNPVDACYEMIIKLYEQNLL